MLRGSMATHHFLHRSQNAAPRGPSYLAGVALTYIHEFTGLFKQQCASRMLTEAIVTREYLVLLLNKKMQAGWTIMLASVAGKRLKNILLNIVRFCSFRHV